MTFLLIVGMAALIISGAWLMVSGAQLFVAGLMFENDVLWVGIGVLAVGLLMVWGAWHLLPFDLTIQVTRP